MGASNRGDLPLQGKKKRRSSKHKKQSSGQAHPSWLSTEVGTKGRERSLAKNNIRSAERDTELGKKGLWKRGIRRNGGWGVVNVTDLDGGNWKKKNRVEVPKSFLHHGFVS